MALDFEASLKVEGRRDGDENIFYIQTTYGIYSEEFKRELITAGAALPDRSYTYPFDVMLIWFKGSHGVSNKVQFLPPPNVDITYDKDGTPTGKYKEAAYDLTVNGPRAVWEQKNVTKTVPLIIDGVKYDAAIENGILIADGLPTKAGK
jgi:hypothetical protein